MHLETQKFQFQVALFPICERLKNWETEFNPSAIDSTALKIVTLKV